MSQDKIPPRRNGHARRLDDLAGRLARQALGSRRMLLAQMMAAWPQVIGSTLAPQTWPVQVRFGRTRKDGATLVLGCPAALAPVLAHSHAQIAERVNLWLGYPAVTRVQLVHGEPPVRPAPPPAKPAPDETAPLPPESEAALAEIEDPEMRAVLAGLARRVDQRAVRG